MSRNPNSPRSSRGMNADDIRAQLGLDHLPETIHYNTPAKAQKALGGFINKGIVAVLGVAIVAGVVMFASYNDPIAVLTGKTTQPAIEQQIPSETVAPESERTPEQQQYLENNPGSGSSMVDPNAPGGAIYNSEHPTPSDDTATTTETPALAPGQTEPNQPMECGINDDGSDACPPEFETSDGQEIKAPLPADEPQNPQTPYAPQTQKFKAPKF